MLLPGNFVKRQISSLLHILAYLGLILALALVLVNLAAVFGSLKHEKLQTTTSGISASSRESPNFDFPTLKNVTIKLSKTKLVGERCPLVKGRRVLINYAQGMYVKSQEKNCESGLAYGFDVCIQFNLSSIDEFFRQVNAELLSRYILAGYAVWKPFIIYKTLLDLNEDDVLFYTDSGAVFIDSPENHFCLMARTNQDIVVFSSGLPERQFSKPSALLIMNCEDKNNCSNTMQRMSGAMIIRKSLRSLVFMASWLTYNQDEKIVNEASDEEIAQAVDRNKYVAMSMKSQGLAFKANRNDQTVLSIMSKRFLIPEWPDPSQYGERGYNAKLKQRKEFASIQKPIITVTRDKN